MSILQSLLLHLSNVFVIAVMEHESKMLRESTLHTGRRVAFTPVVLMLSNMMVKVEIHMALDGNRVGNLEDYFQLLTIISSEIV